MKPQILMVDDELDILDAATMSLKNEFELHTAASVGSAKSILAQRKIDVVIADLNFEGQEEDGIELIDHINRKYSDIPVVVLSADALTKRVVSATRRDLSDFITKEGDYRETLRVALRKGLEQRRQGLATKDTFHTNSNQMKSLLLKVDKIASRSTDCSILIIGETGTGKEVLTKYIASKMKKPLVAANMASIPKETAESELFGHMAGSFTGAVKNKLGLIEFANNGLFFLDELGECSMSLQAKLLRVIQEKEIMPVGSLKPRRIDVQFIAATNKNLQQMVDSKEFRLDLLQRLNTFVLEIPPLRDRPEDIILYATQFVEELRGSFSFQIDPTAFDALIDYHWPGNVRELRNIIERIITLSTTRVMDATSVCSAIGEANTFNNEKFKLSRKQIVRASSLINALEKENGNKEKAAQLLGVNRATVFRWIKELGIDQILADNSHYQKVKTLKQGAL